MDLNKVVSDTVARMSNEGVIETEIKSSIEKSVKTAIKSLFGSYQFQSDIEKKLQVEVDGVLNEFSFASYGDMIRNNVMASVQEIVGYEVSAQAKSALDAVFGDREKPVKLSEIIDLFKSVYNWMDHDEQIELSIKRIDRDRSSAVSWLQYNIEMEADSDKVTFSVHTMIYKDNPKKFTILCLKSPHLESLSAESPRLFNQKRLEKYEILLLNVFFADREIEMDVTDEDEIDLYIHEQDDY